YPDKLGLAALPVPVMQLGRVRSARVTPHALGLLAAQRPEPFFQALQVPLVAALAALFHGALQLLPRELAVFLREPLLEVCDLRGAERVEQRRHLARCGTQGPPDVGTKRIVRPFEVRALDAAQQALARFMRVFCIFRQGMSAVPAEEGVDAP